METASYANNLTNPGVFLSAMLAFLCSQPYSQRHAAQNPYFFANTLGNPTSRKTILNLAQSNSTAPPHKRQRMDPHPASLDYFCVGSSSGKNSSSARGAALSHDSEPDIQVLSTPTSSRKRQRRHSLPHNAEIMVLEDSSEDIGELVVRIEVDKTGDRSSPESPMVLPKRRQHGFDTRPGQLSSKITKDQQREGPSRPVLPSMSVDEIERFTLKLPLMPGLQSPAIPPGSMENHRRRFEISRVSASLGTTNSLRGIPALNLVGLSKHSTVASRMERKDQVRVDLAIVSVTGFSSLCPASQVSGLAMSLSGLTDFSKKRNAKLLLPLEVWYLGHVEFRERIVIPHRNWNTRHKKRC